MSSLLAELKEILGSQGVLTGEDVVGRNTSFWDASPLLAKAVIRPSSTEEVSQALALCYQHNQTVVTLGGATGCSQGALSNSDNIVLSTERMNQIIELDPVGRTATVEAGCILQTLQEKVADMGLLFPLDLGARGSCTIGGNVATNAGGINVLRYGMARELVLGIEAVLPDGRVVSSLNRMIKNNAGYDLKQLFIGTEGTLGVVTKVVVKLKEQPVSANSALVGLDNFDAVAKFLKHVDRSLGGQLSSYEVMWGNYFREVTEPGWHTSPMSRDYNFYVVLEAQGAEAEHDTAHFQAVMEQALENGLIVDAVLPKSETERNACWAIREDFEALLHYSPVFLYDVSLPIKDMEAYVEELQQGLKAKWADVRFHALGHIGDGNLHFFVCPQEEGDTEEQHKASDTFIYETLSQYGGSVTAEHGIGLEKKDFLSLCRSETEIALMRQLKQFFDPKGLLNPGKVFDL